MAAQPITTGDAAFPGRAARTLRAVSRLDTRAPSLWLARHLRGAGQWWWVPLLYAAVLLLVYRDLWWQHGTATAFGWDVPAAYGPNLEAMGRDLADGSWPWWSPYDKGGFSIVGDPECDRYHPLGLLFVCVSALLGGAWWLIHVKVLVYHLVAALALHAFMRTRGVGLGPALVAGAALVASTPLLVHKASMVIWPMVFAPLVWIAIDRACAAPTLRRGVVLGGACGVVVTAGSPPGVFYALLLIAPYGALRAWQAARDRRTRAAWGALARALGAALVITAAIALVVLVPLAEAIAQSTRAGVSGGRFALDGGQTPAQILPAMLVPTAGKLEGYLGGLALLLAIVGLLLRPRPAELDRGAALLFAALAVLGVVLMFGAATPVLPALVDLVPGFGRLRVPGRYKLVTAWAVAPLVGYGLHALLAAERREVLRRVLPALGLLVALGLVLVLVVPQVPMPPSPRGTPWGLVALALGAAIVVGLALAPARARWTRPTLIALALAVVALDAPSFLHTPGSPPIADPQRPHDDELALVARLTGARDAYRIYDEFVFAERVGLRRRLRNFRGYPSVDQLSQRRYVDVLEYAGKDPSILTDFGVRWILHAPHYLNGMSTNFLKQPPTVAQGFEPREPRVYEARHPAALAVWYGAVRRAAPAAVLGTMRAAQDAAGVRRYAVVGTDEPNPPALAALPDASAVPPVEATVLTYAPDEIRLAVDAPAPGLLVLSELWDRGWRVWIDGVPAAPVRANYLLRGVVVPAGAHAITWRYEPAGMRALTAAMVLGWVSVLAALLWPRRRPWAGAPA
jgi:hypothetical protein